MNGQLMHSLLFWVLPFLFAGLVVWLQRWLTPRKPYLQIILYLMAGYILLGTYQCTSDWLVAIEKASRIDEETVTVLTDPAVLKQGGIIFDTRCISCHGAHGEGVIGPNLTDDYWIYGGSIRDIFRIIRHGVPDTPMVAWKHTLTDEEQQAVANYIYSLWRSNPPNSKPPQGFLYIRR